MPRLGGSLCAGIAVLGGAATLAATLLTFADAAMAGGLWWVLAGVLPLYAAAAFAFWRRPQHAAVRCLLVAASLLALSTFFEYLLRSGQVVGTMPLWLLDAAYLFTETGASLAGVGFFALFPVGRPERPYERLMVRAALGTALLVPALVLVARHELTVNPFSFSHFPPVANPTFVPALSPLGGLVLAAYVGLWMVALPLAALMLALRYRRSGFAERRQIRWLLLGVSVGALGTVPWVLGMDALGAVIGVPCMLATVGCIVVALLDAGLVDVDAIIRKSLVYGILWLLIALGFVAAASVLGVAASRQLPLAVAISLAITAALLFQPARRRLERLAERWLFGERLSHYEVVTRFGDALEEVGDLDDLLPKLADTVRLGLGVRFAGVRLAPPPERPDARMPQAQSGTGTEPELVIGLVHHGIEVGAIECGPKRQGPFTDADTRLLATLAQQAAAVAYGLRLRTEQAEHLADISRHSAELSRSRARLVEVQDAERRRLQTQVHDGVQQSVAALSVRLGLARNQLRRGDEGVAVTLADLQADIDRLLDQLRDLAHSIRPSVLSDRGLLEAVEAQAGRLPVPVVIRASSTLRGARFPAAIEDAAWFGIAEGLTNALKHARADRVEVGLSRRDGVLDVEIRDRGPGFDPCETTGFGLATLRDRMAVLGGQLIIESSPGTGVRLRMMLPLPEQTDGNP